MLLCKVRGRGTLQLCGREGALLHGQVGCLALPGMSLMLGVVLGDISRWFVSSSLRHCLIRSSVVRLLPL